VKAPDRNALFALRRLWVLRAQELKSTARRLPLADAQYALGASETYRECAEMLLAIPGVVPSQEDEEA